MDDLLPVSAFPCPILPTISQTWWAKSQSAPNKNIPERTSASSEIASRTHLSGIPAFPHEFVPPILWAVLWLTEKCRLERLEPRLWHNKWSRQTTIPSETQRNRPTGRPGSAMNDAILQEISDFCRQTGLAESTFGRRGENYGTLGTRL